MVAQPPVLRARLAELQALEKDERARKEDQISLYEILIEMTARGISLRPVSLYESHAQHFTLLADDVIILPPLSSMPGVGLAAAENLARARDEGPFLSQEDMARRKVAKSVIQALMAAGALGELPETSQTSLLTLAEPEQTRGALRHRWTRELACSGGVSVKRMVWPGLVLALAFAWAALAEAPAEAPAVASAWATAGCWSPRMARSSWARDSIPLSSR
jgi:hypothetical protein